MSPTSAKFHAEHLSRTYPLFLMSQLPPSGNIRKERTNENRFSCREHYRHAGPFKSSVRLAKNNCGLPGKGKKALTACVGEVKELTGQLARKELHSQRPSSRVGATEKVLGPTRWRSPLVDHVFFTGENAFSVHRCASAWWNTVLVQVKALFSQFSIRYAFLKIETKMISFWKLIKTVSFTF